MITLRRKMSLIAMGICLLAGTLSTTVASASPDYSYAMEVCNAYTSEGKIRAFDYKNNGYSYTLNPGQCMRNAFNELSQLRVHVYDKSYKWGIAGQGYTECRVGPYDSNPPDSANGTRITYHVYKRASCFAP